jgi:hypothetical protein
VSSLRIIPQAAKPALKQIESTAWNIVIIILGAPAAGIGLSFLNGELKQWSDLPKALDHGLFIGVMMAFAWLGMASPLAGRVRTLLGSIRTSADGSTLEQRVELPANSSATATINPTTQQITVKEEPKL